MGLNRTLNQERNREWIEWAKKTLKDTGRHTVIERERVVEVDTKGRELRLERERDYWK